MSDLFFVLPNEEMESKALNFKKEFFDYREKVINGSYMLDMDKYSYLEWARNYNNECRRVMCSETIKRIY